MLRNIKLESANIRSVNFKNQLNNGGSASLEVHLGAEKVKDPENSKKVIGSIRCNIFSVDEEHKKIDLLELNLVVEGRYSLENDFDESDSELEQGILITLFPYLQNYIRIITSLSDMPPISLPYPIASE